MKTENAAPRPSADNVLFLGQARDELARELAKTLTRVVEANLGRDSYFILVHAKKHPFIPKMLRTVVTLLSAEPPRMLGTICFRIDNREGRAERLWVLPPDIPRPMSLIGPEYVSGVAKGAMGMPIIY